MTSGAGLRAMKWLARLFGAAALAGFAAAVWYAGPLVSFDDRRILEDPATRIAIIGAALALVGLYYGARLLRDRRAQRALEEAIADRENRDDGRILDERMTEALAVLKSRHGRRNFLHDLPWYMLIGPPGAGKTTALVNSGLPFPLAGEGAAQPVEGVGGTRFCDWWFTQDAVLIDTAGRYTTRDSDPQRDGASWLAFLGSLKRHRPTQPLNGVIIAIGLADLMADDGRTLGAHVSEVRNRLRELNEVLRINFPVYVLFTKADLVGSFAAFFASLDEGQRRQVWGHTFQTQDRTRNMAGEVPAAFDRLVAQLACEATDRLDEEPDPRARAAIFGFPAQFARLREPVTAFLQGVFDPASAVSSATLRGFYFSSGTQHGTPVDQLLGTMEMSLGRPVQAELSGTGRSYFLHDLLAKVIFAEAGWVSSDRVAQRRAAIMRNAGLAAAGLAAVLGLGVVAAGYRDSLGLVSAMADATAGVRASSAALLAQPEVMDTDLAPVVATLDALRTMPVGYDHSEAAAQATDPLGLSQRERLLSASVGTYRRALERLMRPRLLKRLEEAVDRTKGEAAAVFEPLKAYLLLVGAAPRPDDDFVIAWFVRDWEDTVYPGPANREGRAALEQHLRAMLALDDEYEPLYAPNRPLVEAAQRSLGRLTLAERADAIVRSAYHAADASTFSLARRGGPDATRVLATTDASGLQSLIVPGIYTRTGFQTVLLDALAGVAQQLVDDHWVLGSSGAQSDSAAELEAVGPRLLDRYGDAFVAAWETAFDRLRLKELIAEAPDHPVLALVASAGSPLTRLFEAAAYEMMPSRPIADSASDQVPAEGEAEAVADERDRGLARIGLRITSPKSQNRAGAMAGAAADRSQLASIEARLRPYLALVSGAPGQRPLDVLAQNFSTIRQSLRLADTAPGQADRASANLRLQVSNLRANASRFPRPLARMVQAAADELEGKVTQASVDQLGKALDDVVAACEAAVGGRYPFVPDSPDDVPIQAFAQVFAPGGLLDVFFARDLSGLVDMSGPAWTWKPGSAAARGLADDALRSFQLAAQIRDAFFHGRQQLPSAALTITPFSLHGDADSALLEVNGDVVESLQSGGATQRIAWPDLGAGLARLTLSPEIAGRESGLSFEGPWALKRLIDRATAQQDGDATELRFLIGGRDVAYRLDGGAAANPFALPALSAFRCPRRT